VVVTSRQHCTSPTNYPLHTNNPPLYTNLWHTVAKGITTIHWVR